jgi:hypothetical protein
MIFVKSQELCVQVDILGHEATIWPPHFPPPHPTFPELKWGVGGGGGGGALVCVSAKIISGPLIFTIKRTGALLNFN